MCLNPLIAFASIYLLYIRNLSKKTYSIQNCIKSKLIILWADIKYGLCILLLLLLYIFPLVEPFHVYLNHFFLSLFLITYVCYDFIYICFLPFLLGFLQSLLMEWQAWLEWTSLGTRVPVGVSLFTTSLPTQMRVSFGSFLAHLGQSTTSKSSVILTPTSARDLALSQWPIMMKQLWLSPALMDIAWETEFCKFPLKPTKPTSLEFLAYIDLKKNLFMNNIMKKIKNRL